MTTKKSPRIEAKTPIEDEEEETQSVEIESEAKKDFRKLIEKYKEKNPIKYAEKAAALLEKLKQL